MKESLFADIDKSFPFSAQDRFKESATYASHTCRVVASNRPTEALASVNLFVFVVIVIINTDSKYLGRELNHGPIASVTSYLSCKFFQATSLTR